MHSLDLNLLEALDALLQEGGVSRAASRMHLTPPAMSRALGRLRDVVGDPLFVRAGRSLVPTPRALALRERVHEALAEVRSVLSPEAPAEPRTLRRAFKVRADDSVSAALGPGLLAHLSEVAPHVTVIFCPEGDEDVAALREGSIDLDVGVQGALAPEIRTRKLFDDQRVVLLRGVQRRGRRPLSCAELARRPHIDVSRRGRTRGPLDDALERQGCVRRVIAVVPNQLAAAVLVARGDAVSLVSREFARSITACLEVAWLPAPITLPPVAVTMAWHPRFDADPAHAWFRDEVVQRVASVVQRTR